MNQVQILTEADRIILTIVFWVALLFPVGLATFWRWWETAFGNSYVWKVILVAVVASPTAFYEMFGVDPESLWFRWYATSALGLIPVVLVWRYWVLLKTQRKGRTLNPVKAFVEWYKSKEMLDYKRDEFR